jgi:nitroreductase
MDLYEVIQTRRSVRSYRPDPIPQEILDRILEATRCAPSSLNIQPVKFVCVTDPAVKRQLTACCIGQSFMEDAPIVVVGCALPTRGTIAGYGSSAQSDVAVAFAYLSLAAAAEGLGTCWITSFDHTHIEQLLSFPEAAQAVLISPLGFPTDKSAHVKHRKPLEEILFWEKFS